VQGSHANVKTLLAIAPKDVLAFERISIVRNPVSRFRSYYAHILRSRHHYRHAEIVRYSFNDFTLREWERGGIKIDSDQFSFLSDEQGRLAVHRVLKFESLDSNWREFAATRAGVGLPIELPHLSRTTFFERSSDPPERIMVAIRCMFARGLRRVVFRTGWRERASYLRS